MGRSPVGRQGSVLDWGSEGLSLPGRSLAESLDLWDAHFHLR